MRQGEIDPGAPSDQVLFKENEVLILKPDYIRGLSPASNSFFVGTVIDVVTVDNSHDHTQSFFKCNNNFISTRVGRELQAR